MNLSSTLKFHTSHFTNHASRQLLSFISCTSDGARSATCKSIAIPVFVRRRNTTVKQHDVVPLQWLVNL